MFGLDRKKILAIGYVLLAMLCWATIPSFLRFLLTPASKGGLGLDIWIVNAMRYSIGALFWLPFVLMKDRSPKRPPDKTERSPLHKNVWLAALVPSIINLFGQAGWGAIPKYLSASITGFGIRLSFLITVVSSLILLPDERRLGRRGEFWLGVIWSILGTLLMSYEGLIGGGRTSVIGFILLFFTVLFWGWYAVTIKKFMVRFNPVISFGVISLYTTVGLIILACFFGDAGMFARMSAKSWGFLIVSGIIGVTFAHVLYYIGIRELGSIVASGILMASPFVTMLVAMATLNETMTGLQAAGGSVIVVGTLFLVIAKARVEKEPVDPVTDAPPSDSISEDALNDKEQDN